MSDQLDISVVIPVFNSEQSLNELAQRLTDVLTGEGLLYELIFVEDYSSDGSWKVLKQVKEQHQKVKLIRLAKNYGQHNATLCGFRHAKGNLILTIDDDLQHQPEDIPQLLEKMRGEDVDIVYAISKDYTHKKGYRKAGSKIWKFGTKNFDEALGEGSSFRLIQREVVEKVCEHRQHFIFIDEMLHWYTEHIAIIKVKFLPRAKGQSGYSGIKLFLMGINLAVFYSSVPLKIMTYGGLLMSLVTFAVGVYFIAKKMIWGTPVQGYTSLIVAIMFSTSLMLICFGVIGQYLGKIYTVLNNKPTYSIKEKHL